ncbi:Dolichyl-diphosphooligosaccharide--protein glycosyltransferase subunit [Armadillidium nasatum]|uniref:Dolichyl-diphosphooligosaccharide--protein glycosyltransferase 48 kDa subunit n=1 Tax=Armadillidium nasatum TaxID=96803 RepID=A0A5N5TLN4_9CRUS|nr:Dolichyl-diphosphooligosaccharide--protein glycosyltransferase subunit [Armadillidium nasatum]
MILLLFVLSLLGTIYCKQTTLVLVDTLATRETHSIFLKSLQERGHDVTVKSADDPSLQITKYGEHIYNNLVILSPGVEEFGGSLSLEAIVEFIDEGGNVLIAGSSETTDLIRELGTEVGVEMDEEGAMVIDHLNYDVHDKGQHSLIAAPNSGLINSAEMVGKPNGSPLLYRGTGLITDPDNPLVLPVLKAASSAYCHTPSQAIVEYPHATGQNMLLVAALQARNNARVVVSGSLEFFSDAFILSSVQTAEGKVYKTSGNGPVVEALSRWVFKEEGVLRVVSVSHHIAGEKEPPPSYTIKDDVEYSIAIERLVGGSWVPFQAPDLQMEFVRIDPFVRLTLKPSSTGLFSIGFKVPDVYGVYQFKVEYNRIGFTRLFSSTQVAVRPFTHTEYESSALNVFNDLASPRNLVI